ncbi:ABC transporter ATP-binding protein [Candidatus Micrarchaeota archaeon]|nr:ABC transporter ATP-binding protein [Candidatus Micrarchaeota archaeon]MBU1930903.1 ABC transporter ATP-binding protein [Candidatus Micrarchaeota archaeon]
MLEIKHLKKHFGGVKAVDGSNFTVKEKTITALIGPNGAGKSTVFNLVSGILKADSGEIHFKKKEITNWQPEKISNLGISRLFQQPTLFSNLTVQENLLLALEKEDTKFWKNLAGKNNVSKEQKQLVKKTLELVSMEKFEQKLARELSFGQKRLVELARAILKPHSFLMLDEPVGGVNPKIRKEIATILLRLKKQGETILLIEHDMNFTLGIADTVIVMDEGKVIAEGKPKSIKKNPKVLEAYLGE